MSDTYINLTRSNEGEDGRAWRDHTATELMAIAASGERPYRHAAIDQLMIRATTEGSADAPEAARLLEEYFQSPRTEQMPSNMTTVAYFDGRYHRSPNYPYLPIIDESETHHDYALCMMRTDTGEPRFQAYCMVDHGVNDVIKRWGRYQEDRRMVMLPAMFELMMRFQTRADGTVDETLTKALSDGARHLHNSYPEAFEAADTMMHGALGRTISGLQPPRGYRVKEELPTMKNYPQQYALRKQQVLLAAIGGYQQALYAPTGKVTTGTRRAATQRLFEIACRETGEARAAASRAIEDFFAFQAPHVGLAFSTQVDVAESLDTYMDEGDPDAVHAPMVRGAETGNYHSIIMGRHQGGEPRFFAGCMHNNTVYEAVDRWAESGQSRTAVMLPVLFELMMRHERRRDGTVDESIRVAINSGVRYLHVTYPESFAAADYMMDGALAQRMGDNPAPARPYGTRAQLPHVRTYYDKYLAFNPKGHRRD